MEPVYAKLEKSCTKCHLPGIRRRGYFSQVVAPAVCLGHRIAGPWALPASHCAGTLTPQHLHPCHLEALFLLVAFGWLQCAFFIYRISTHKNLMLNNGYSATRVYSLFVGMVVLYQSPEHRVYLKIPSARVGVFFFFSFTSNLL